jgi:5-formyltetrahydrofolate cyclo-ligase
MATANATRERVWTQLRDVALPDSRFHFNFAEYIPDFTGSDRALQRLIELPEYQSSQFLFVTPDNCLTGLREQALLDGKTMVVSTYGIYRGLIMLSPERVPPGQERWASWLDGLEYFGRPVTLAELSTHGRFDLLVTGASAVSREGIRFGKGHGFFDVEWGMFCDIGAVDASTPVVAFVHDVQVVDDSLAPSPTDTVVDYIVTPENLIHVPHIHERPSGIMWDILDPELLESIPPLQELRQMVKGGQAA